MPHRNKIITIKKRSDFLAAAASGKKWVAPGFILQIGKPAAQVENTNTSSVRYGLTASTKVGNAVVRNRARRRLRALAQEVLESSADPAAFYVLIARKDTTVARDYAEMRADLEKGLRRLGVWREVVPNG